MTKSQCQITGQVPEGAVEIRIVSDDAGGFVPGELTVDLGQTVAFVNAHHDEHTATGSGFDTGVIAPGQVATVVLDTAGRFAYACQIHPVMTGRISVRGTTASCRRRKRPPRKSRPDATTVRIVNLAFDPAQVTIATGTAVSWINEDSVPHTVTSTDGAFDSGIFDPGANFTWTFDQPGSFPYACQIHPQMQGTVIAEGEAVASASPVSATESQTEPAAEQAAPRRLKPPYRSSISRSNPRLSTCRPARQSSGRTTDRPRIRSPEILPTRAFSNLARLSRTRLPRAASSATPAPFIRK